MTVKELYDACSAAIQDGKSDYLVEVIDTDTLEFDSTRIEFTSIGDIESLRCFNFSDKEKTLYLVDKEFNEIY